MSLSRITETETVSFWLTQQTTNGGAIPNLLMHGSHTSSSVSRPLPENG